MKVEVYPIGDYQANCYLIWNEQHVLIVDPGGSSRKVVERIQQANGVVDAILLTHGHFDHFGGVDFFRKKFNCPVFIEAAELPLASNAKLNCSIAYHAIQLTPPVQFYQPQMRINNFTFEVIVAPGHTDGSVLLVFDTFMMSGDVLFKESVGRHDLPTGSYAKLMKTLESIKRMDPNLVVYPGHGECTTIHDEIVHNPFL